MSRLVKDTAKTQAELLTAALGERASAEVVVGLDLSLTSTGWARNERGRLTTGRVVTSPDHSLYGEGLAERLLHIVDQLNGVLKGADLVMVEAPFASLSGGNAIFLVHGAIRLVLGLSGALVVPVAPTTLKVFALGSGGKSDKVDVALAASRRLGWEGAGNDEADAAWLSEMGWHLLDRPNVELPGTHLRALETVRNPGKTSRAVGKRRVQARVAELMEASSA